MRFHPNSRGCQRFSLDCARRGLTFKVYASPAPNRHTADESPGKIAYSAWASRALRYAEGERHSMGNPTSEPGAFRAVSSVKPREYMVTSENSWRAVANPTGAFAGQKGNRMHFVLHVQGDGVVRFKPEDISWRYWAAGAPWGTTRSFGSPAESVDCVHGWGYDWGDDRAKGGTGANADTKVCNDHSALIDELIHVGPGYGLTSDICFTAPETREFCDGVENDTLQQVLGWYCDDLNNSAIDNPMGMQFTIAGSDANTYTHTESRSNPEFGQPLNPATCALFPAKKKRSGASIAPASTPTSPPPVYTGEELVKRGFQISATHGLRSGVQFQRLDSRGIGISAVIEAGLIDAVDVWGYAEQMIEVCFPPGLGPGPLLFLDATMVPRTVRTMPSILRAGRVCGTVNGPGTVVMVESWPGASMPAEPLETRPLQNCMITTAHILNFRDAPGGGIMETLPYDVTLTATERTEDWFKVDYHGTLGWISADYVETRGSCA